MLLTKSSCQSKLTTRSTTPVYWIEMWKLILLVYVTSVIGTPILSTEIQPVIVAPCNIYNTSGLTCSDCETLTRCVFSNNAWQSYDVDKCDKGQGLFCNSFEQKCSNATGSCNRLLDFHCSQEGYFPNPYTCQEYYSCVRLSQNSEILPFPRTCPIGTAYSVATTACTLRIQDVVCSRLHWYCNSPGDLGLWPGSDNIFYVCLRDPVTNELGPYLQRCIHNQIFDGTNCVNRSAEGSTTTMEITTTPTTAAPQPD